MLLLETDKSAFNGCFPLKACKTGYKEVEGAHSMACRRTQRINGRRKSWTKIYKLKLNLHRPNYTNHRRTLETCCIVRDWGRYNCLQPNTASEGDMIDLHVYNVYRYTHQQTRVTPGNISIILSNSNTRGHCFKLDKPRCNTTLCQKTFPHRAIDDWNGLPDEVVQGPSVDTFKGRLDKHWCEIIHTYIQ